MPTAVEYGLITSWHDATAIEYGLKGPAHANTQVVNNDGYTWSNAWHTQSMAEYGVAAPQGMQVADWQVSALIAAPALVLAAVVVAVRRRVRLRAE